MRKSKQRVALEGALLEASSAQEKSDIANRLSLLIERESRDRARRRRERAKIAASKPTPEPKYDGDEPFLNDDGTPFQLTASLPLTPQAPPAVAPPPPAPPPPREPEQPPVTRWTRELDTFETPSERATYPTAEFYQHLTCVDPLGFLGTRAVMADAYTAERGWQSEFEQRKKEAEEEAWRDRYDRR